MTSEDDLTATDEEILDELQHGARTKGALVDATERHRNTIGHRLDVLEASGIIDEIHDSTALYELVDDPREDSGGGSGIRTPEEARIRKLEERNDDLRAERDDLEQRLQEARQQADAAAGDGADDQYYAAIEDAHEALARAADELPEGVPGRTAVQDALRTLEEVLDE